MQHPIEICLTGCEWIQERLGEAAARKARRALEKKAFLTFLSQGAVGGMVGYFLIAAFFAISKPSGYNFFYLIGLPVILVFGSAIGSITAVFVWLPGVLLKRRLGFVARAGAATAALMMQGFAFSYLTGNRGTDEWSFQWVIAFCCVISLPVALMTGSTIRPCRMIALGSAQRKARRNFGSWLSFPFGFLLRAASIFGLLEALMVLALWISARTVDWLESPPREDLPAIGVTVLYFTASAYFSIRSPRKFVLLPITILFNLPLVGLIEHLRRIDTVDSNALASVFMVFICLWAGYTLGRMIAPESALGFVNSPSETADAHAVSRTCDGQVRI